jgi:hypothetical protein
MLAHYTHIFVLPVELLIIAEKYMSKNKWINEHCLGVKMRKYLWTNIGSPCYIGEKTRWILQGSRINIFSIAL